ncbi:MAG: NACHT domain-containing protein, partial [Methanococcoides sp.]|nr:NACHT domain-containing protein [Methanococcoides sp.]
MKNSEWPAVSGGLERYNFPYQLEMEQDVTMQGGGLKQDEKELLNRYLKDVIAATYRIDIQGIYSMSGAGHKSIYFPIEQHYTPLKTMSNLSRLEEAVGMIREDMRSAERVLLTDLLSSCKRLLIIGEPGGGKTTFLRLIACVLAKDALEQGEPVRKLHLGLSLDGPVPIPILIRLSALAGTLKKGCPAVNGAGAWRVLLQTMEELFGKENSALLQILLDNGNCAVLLDGLDEEPDQNIRKQMVDVTNAVLHHWEDNLFVLSSRPFGYHAVAALEKMATAHIDSFKREEILEFLNRWANALFPDEEKRNREAYLPELESAVLNMPRIRRMAKNPVMLTCLCVVHWNERKLPEGKADLLAAVLRWLLNAKEEKRRQRGYSSTFAEECFKALAWAMTSHKDGKQVRADLTWAAEQLAV